LIAVALLTAAIARAHTLPISYLRLVPDADYLHLELVFNPFELTFMSELDDDQDAELSPAELAAHGATLARRVSLAFKLSAGSMTLAPEIVGMDPDMNGHHVRLRAHYKVDARRLPLTVHSDFISLTAGSHLTQVTYVNGTNTLLAQLDAQSLSATFAPPPGKPAERSAPPPGRFGGLVVSGLLASVAGLWFVARRGIRRRPIRSHVLFRNAERDIP
jgi:hypothetical protein